MTEERIEKAIRDASLRIRMPLGGIAEELYKLRELLAERLPVAVQPKPEDRTGQETEQPAEDKTEAGDLTKYQEDTIKALEHCVNHPGCEGCPLWEDDRCTSSTLPKRALATIKQLQEQLRTQPEPREEEQFELTKRERDLIRAIKCCVRDSCKSCELVEDRLCLNHMVNEAFDMIDRQLEEKGVDIDDI